MKTKKWTAKEGRIPGTGKWQQDVTKRPDDPSLVSRVQLVELVGVSNAAVISKAIERLRIAPSDEGTKTRSTYNNGGSGQRTFEVPYFEPGIVDQIRAELQQNSVDFGEGRFKYAGKTFRWR
ncbi:MAG: hypothetical protein ABSF35_07095 [Polyangia bacterium]|jgi:hypothetical protein